MYDKTHLVSNATTPVVYPQQVWYRCNVGYAIDRRFQDESSNAFFASSCVASGTFSELIDSCKPLICGVPPAVENATSNIDANDSSTFLEDVEYHCDHGHMTDGDSNSNTSFRVVCGAEGECLQAPSSGCKHVVCGKVHVVLNTLPLPNGTQEKSCVFGDHSPVCAYKFGFSTSEDDVRREKAKLSLVCSSNGEFNITEDCKKVNDCIENDCGDNGDCSHLSNPVGNDSVHHCACVCDSGFEEVSTGTYKICQNFFDCPLSSTCNLIGTCEDALQSFWCSGNAGFETVMKNRPNNFTCTRQVCGEPRLVRPLSNIMEGIMSISKKNLGLKQSVLKTASYNAKRVHNGVYSSVLTVLPVKCCTPPRRNHSTVDQQRRCTTRRQTTCVKKSIRLTKSHRGTRTVVSWYGVHTLHRTSL